MKNVIGQMGNCPVGMGLNVCYSKYTLDIMRKKDKLQHFFLWGKGWFLSQDSMVLFYFSVFDTKLCKLPIKYLVYPSLSIIFLIYEKNMFFLLGL